MVRARALAPRPGIRRIARAAATAGWQLAVASTSAVDSVRAVLDAAAGPDFAAHFSVFADDVAAHKKSAPDSYLLALRELGTHATEAVVIEDPRNGLLAAAGAGIGCLITVSTYAQQENMTGAALVVSSLGDPGGNEVRVLANKTGTVPGRYITLPNIAACARLPGPFGARQTA